MGQIQAEADFRSANCVEERIEPFRSAFEEEGGCRDGVGEEGVKGRY